jgi:hypothetical protein
MSHGSRNDFFVKEIQSEDSLFSIVYIIYDRDFRIKDEVPEDAIWTMLRIAPHGLPRGEFLMIPGTVYVRLAHRQLKPRKASTILEAVAEKSLEGNPMVRYEINLPEEHRTLSIFFEKNFPYRIQKWEETYRGLTDKKTKVLTTRSVRTHTIMDPYWQHNGNKDRVLLKRLGLSARELGKQ